MPIHRKVLLISPSYGREAYGFRYNASSILPSLGLGYVASALRRFYQEVRIHHCEVMSDHIDDVLCDYPADIIGITISSGSITTARNICAKIRFYRSKTPIILGGPLASRWTSCISDAFSDVDYVVAGEAENCFASDLCNGLFDQQVPTTPTIVKYGIVSNLSQNPIIPAHDLLHYDLHRPSFHRHVPRPFACVQTARGCPFNCDYCETTKITGSTIRGRPIESIMEELEWLSRSYGIKGLIVWDDVFTLEKSRAFALCDLFSRYGLVWNCNTRPDYVDADILSAMAASGCRTVFLGIEGTTSSELGALGRRCDSDVFMEAFNACRQAGLLTVAACIVGIPGDNPQVVIERVRNLHMLKPDFVLFSTLRRVDFSPFSNAVISLDKSLEYLAYRVFFQNTDYWIRWESLARTHSFASEILPILRRFAKSFDNV